MYLFAWRSPAQGGRLLAPHTVEIPFVSDNTGVPTEMTRLPTAKALAARTADAWVAFARRGDPNHPGLPSWPAYDQRRRATMVFDDQCRVQDDPSSEARRFWASI